MVIIFQEWYQVRWNVYGTLAGVERTIGDGIDDRVWYFLEYGFYNVQIRRNGQKFYYTFDQFQLVGYTFKFELRITAQNI